VWGEELITPPCRIRLSSPLFVSDQGLLYVALPAPQGKIAIALLEFVRSDRPQTLPRGYPAPRDAH
jgi:hypothetical protein